MKNDTRTIRVELDFTVWLDFIVELDFTTINILVELDLTPPTPEWS